MRKIKNFFSTLWFILCLDLSYSYTGDTFYKEVMQEVIMQTTGVKVNYGNR